MLGICMALRDKNYVLGIFRKSLLPFVGFPFAHSSSCSSLDPLLWGLYTHPIQNQCCPTFN